MRNKVNIYFFTIPWLRIPQYFIEFNSKYSIPYQYISIENAVVLNCPNKDISQYGTVRKLSDVHAHTHLWN